MRKKKLWAGLLHLGNPSSLTPLPCNSCEQLDDEVDDLHATEDGEAGEEPHGAANESELRFQGHLYILLYFIIGGRVEVDLDQLQGGGL